MTTPLTEADLDNLDALAEAATPGPWLMSAHDDRDSGTFDAWADVIPPGGDESERGVLTALDMLPKDARFVCASRLAIPALVAEVRRLRGVVPSVAIGARLRDLTVAQLEALPVGARFVDENDLDPEADSDPIACAFTKLHDGLWYAPALKRNTSADLLATWGTARDDYRLAHLPESR